MKGFRVLKRALESRRDRYLVESVFSFWTYGISGEFANPFPVGSSVIAKIMRRPTGSGNTLLIWNISEVSTVPSSLIFARYNPVLLTQMRSSSLPSESMSSPKSEWV